MVRTLVFVRRSSKNHFCCKMRLILFSLLLFATSCSKSPPEVYTIAKKEIAVVFYRGQNCYELLALDNGRLAPVGIEGFCTLNYPINVVLDLPAGTTPYFEGTYQKDYGIPFNISATLHLPVDGLSYLQGSRYNNGKYPVTLEKIYPNSICGRRLNGQDTTLSRSRYGFNSRHPYQSSSDCISYFTSLKNLLMLFFSTKFPV